MLLLLLTTVLLVELAFGLIAWWMDHHRSKIKSASLLSRFM